MTIIVMVGTILNATLGRNDDEMRLIEGATV